LFSAVCFKLEQKESGKTTRNNNLKHKEFVVCKKERFGLKIILKPIVRLVFFLRLRKKSIL
jgi:hypothetical protein